MPRSSNARKDHTEIDPSWSNWITPLCLKAGPYRQEIITNPAEALSFMANRWPGKKGEEYLTARHLASEFLRRRATRDQVRAALVAAADIEGLLG